VPAFTAKHRPECVAAAAAESSLWMDSVLYQLVCYELSGNRGPEGRAERSGVGSGYVRLYKEAGTAKGKMSFDILSIKKKKYQPLCGYILVRFNAGLRMAVAALTQACCF